MKNNFKLMLIFVLLMFSVVTLASIAAEYPEKDIRMICPWGAGGGTDAITRKISQIAEKSLPVSIYVENMDGGMSGTGVYTVMQSKLDGSTLGTLTYDSVITVPWKELVPGYSMDKLALLCRLTSEADALVVRQDSKYKSFEELVKAAKENPEGINIGIQELGSRTHIAVLQLQEKVGIEFNVISYTGGAGPQKEALLSGEAEVIITSLGDFAPLINSGDARGLVELSATRNVKFTDVPTLKELGYDLEVVSFVLVAAPAGTPEDILSKLEKTFDDAYHTEEFLDWLNMVGVTSAWLGREEVNKWAVETQTKYFDILNDLTEQGIIE